MPPGALRRRPRRLTRSVTVPGYPRGRLSYHVLMLQSSPRLCCGRRPRQRDLCTVQPLIVSSPAGRARRPGLHALCCAPQHVTHSIIHRQPQTEHTSSTLTRHDKQRGDARMTPAMNAQSVALTYVQQYYVHSISYRFILRRKTKTIEHNPSHPSTRSSENKQNLKHSSTMQNESLDCF